ncbi:MAG: malate dehydrogenase [Gammaproteobacteria bacterium]
MSDTVNITITGAAGQIAYALLFRLAAHPAFAEIGLNLRLLEVEPALPALEGVKMELRDGAFPALRDITTTGDAETAFGDADMIFMVGARPRSAGMERKDLLSANAAIFSAQGRAINKVAKKTAGVLVVGNPANTNCLIAQQNAPDMPPSAFTAMTRLDHNRLMAQLAEKAGQPLAAVKGAIIWGNHSATQYPDIHHATIGGKAAMDIVGEEWYKSTMIPAVQQRGAAIIKARGASSAASAASAAFDHSFDWWKGGDDIVSMAIVSGGEYGIEKGLVYSYPMRCQNGEAVVVEGLDVNAFGEEKMRVSERELQEERDAVRHLLP